MTPLRETELPRTTLAADKRLARHLESASTEGALSIVRGQRRVPRGPLVEEALCALLDRGDDRLTAGILWQLTIEDCGSPLPARAAPAIEDPQPVVRPNAITESRSSRVGWPPGVK
jgi:hypothetical protein